VLSQAVEDIARKLYIRALKILPGDVKQALEKAYEMETDSPGKEILETILCNIKVAKKTDNIVCQDTGIPVYFLRMGTEFPLGATEVTEAIRVGCKHATLEHPLRPNIVHPFTRVNTHTNVGTLVPVVYFDFLPKVNYLEMMMIPKGSGSENQSFLEMLVPAEGLSGIKKFVLESIIKAGASPCPPTVIGVGIGGTFELCAMLAKKAIIRPLGSFHPNQEIAILEQELLLAANQTGIGPMGLGGNTTALAVHIEIADTHISQMPVAVNLQCWAARRAGARIYSSGQIDYVWDFGKKGKVITNV